METAFYVDAFRTEETVLSQTKYNQKIEWYLKRPLMKLMTLVRAI
jgi:hypothetical protein